MFRSKLALIILCLALSLPAQAANQWRAGTTAQTPPGTTLINDIDTVVYQNMTVPLDRVLAGHRQGMNLQYSSAGTIVATAGEVVASNAAETIRLMLRNTTSTSITFANIDTGAEAAATTYYVYAGTSTASSATASFYISTSSTTPSGVTYYKRLGSFYNDGSSNISAINNDDQYAEVGTPVSKSDSTTYQALTDGDVVVTLVAGSSGNSSYSTGYTDSSSSPATVMGYCSAFLNAQADHFGDHASFTMPVRAGDYYKVVRSEQSGATAATQTIYFIPKQ